MAADRITRRVRLATGVTVAYLEQGDPQAVPPTLRAFAMDQRGDGDADKPADGYVQVNFADDIEAFMDVWAYSRLCCSAPRAVARAPRVETQRANGAPAPESISCS